jgi:hypothetical protein
MRRNTGSRADTARPLGIDDVVVRVPTAARDEVLPLLDKYAEFVALVES